MKGDEDHVFRPYGPIFKLARASTLITVALLFLGAVLPTPLVACLCLASATVTLITNIRLYQAHKAYWTAQGLKPMEIRKKWVKSLGME